MIFRAKSAFRNGWAGLAGWSLLALATAAPAAVAPATATSQTSSVRPKANGTPAVVSGPLPPFVAQTLILVDVPRGVGPVETLFNGKDLTGWELWLGYENPAMTYNPTGGVQPVGTRPPPPGTTGVVSEDGEPAIMVAGRLNGSLLHRGDYGNYHAQVEFKYSRDALATPELRPNTGLLYHSFDVPGSAFGTWAGSIEFQMQHGSNGMAIPVGRKSNGHVTVGDDAGTHRFMPSGVERELRGRPQTEPHSDAEHPIGTWNQFDLYVLGDHAVYVVNGVPVMEVRDLIVVGPDGKKTPLTHGHLQLELEGAKAYFRHITVQSISSLPRIVVR